MENQKKIKASAVAALGFMALGLIGSEVAESHTLNFNVNKTFQAVSVSLDHGSIDPFGSSIDDENLQCKNELTRITIKQNSECLVSTDWTTGARYSLKVGNLRSTQDWSGGPNSFWVRTAFNLIAPNGASVGTGHVDEKFNIVSR